MSLPAYVPVNASSVTSRSPSHDSDSRWLASPFLTTLSFATPCRFIPALSARLGPPWQHREISSLTDPTVQISRSGFLKQNLRLRPGMANPRRQQRVTSIYRSHVI